MKKFAAAILSILYLATSIGATVQMHYCMGELERISLSVSNSEKCPYCGMPKITNDSKGCCKDEQKQVRLSQDQVVASFANKIMNVAPETLPQHLIEIPPLFLVNISEDNPLSNSPPQAEKTPVYLKNRNLRI